MSRSRTAQIRDQLARQFDEAKRYVSMWAMLRLYERDDTREPAGQPVRWVQETPGGRCGLFGGLWDTTLGAWADGGAPDPLDVVELPCHAGQLPLLFYSELAESKPRLMRLMVLGGPGSGKTRFLSIAALIGGLELPHKASGMVGATRDRVDVMWVDFLAVCPSTWIRRKVEGKGRSITLWNGHRFDFIAAKEPSKLVGSPIQGKSWTRCYVDETQNIHDRSQMDIDERGRRAGTKYFVLESATNFGLGHFETRKERYKASKYHDIRRLNPLDNVFVPLDYWERFADFYSATDYKRRILAEDVPPESRTYPAFNFADSVRPRPRSSGSGWVDITEELTLKLYGQRFGRRKGWRWVAGTDWGRLHTVTEWLRAYREPTTGDVLWWACQETTSGSHSTAAHHARRLTQFAHPSDFIVIADPGINTKDADKSDYELARREGLTVVPAYGRAIERLHRVNMFNALLEDAHGRRRFFVDCDETRKPACPKLVQSCLTMELGENGEVELVRKDYSDPTHWPAAAQFGLFPFEQIRGRTTFETITGFTQDPLLAEADRYHRGSY